MRRSVFYLFALTAMALTAFAADVTGKWTGTLTPDTGNTQSAYAVLKQDGTALTGTAGPNESEQYAIQAGKIDGNKVTIQVRPADSDAVYTCNLALEGERLTGELVVTRGEQSMKAKMELARVK